MVPTKNNYWFILGQAPHVSLAELFSIYPGTAGNFLYTASSGAARLTLDTAPTTLTKIAGTIKVGREISALVTPEELLMLLKNEFAQGSGRAEFGISIYGKEPPQARTALASELGHDLKKLLVAGGTPARFVDNRGEPVLSSASVVHNKLLEKGKEFLLIEQPGGFAVAVTKVVQPFEDFSNRDFGRPGRDDKSGMLPPKLALMMLNISGATTGQVVYDPFCGSGTVITEAMLQGFTNLIASDLSDRAIDDTQKNIAWTREQNTSTANALIKILVSDAREISKKIPANSVNAIVAEPFLGPPMRGGEKSNVINKIIDELQPLYKAALQEFVKILAPGSVVVMIIPRWYCNGAWLTLSNLLPITNKRFGLQPVQLLPKEISKDPFVLYHRPGQFVGREIWKLQLTEPSVWQFFNKRVVY